MTLLLMTSLLVTLLLMTVVNDFPDEKIATEQFSKGMKRWLQNVHRFSCYFIFVPDPQ